MFGYTKENWLYLQIPKNGSSTFKTLLTNNGWKFVHYDDNLDLTNLTIWAHITDPEKRHTKV